MSDSLTQAQKAFVQGSKLFGCSFLQTLTMAAHLWHPADLADMLEYMLDNPNSTPEELFEKCLEISSRRPNSEEETACGN